MAKKKKKKKAKDEPRVKSVKAWAGHDPAEGLLLWSANRHRSECSSDVRDAPGYDPIKVIPVIVADARHYKVVKKGKPHAK